jgi:hypothetical protein
VGGAGAAARAREHVGTATKIAASAPVLTLPRFLKFPRDFPIECIGKPLRFLAADVD